VQTAWRLWQAGDLEAAQRACLEAVASTPGDADAWRLCSRIALQRGDRDEALRLLGEGFEATGAPALAQDLASWHLRSRNPVSARRWLHRLPPAGEPRAQAWRAFQFAQCDWLEGLHEAAVTGFSKACELDPADARYPMRLARATASLGRAAEAAAYLDARPPRGLSADAHALRILCELDLGGPAPALARAERAFAEHGAHPMLSHVLAALLTLGGREADLPAEAREAIRADARAAAAWESFSYAWAQEPKPAFHGLDTGVLGHAAEAAPPGGQVLEFGVYQGLSIRFIADSMSAPVHGFDSFRGLPKAWKADEAAGSYDAGGRIPEVPDNVELHAGWFEQTLPPFVANHPQPVRLMHIDCDIYSSTATVLRHTAGLLRPGSIVVFDEYGGYPGWRGHEFRAWRETVMARSLRYEYLAFNLLARKTAVRVLG